MYQTSGEDGSTISIVFLPDNEALICYDSPEAKKLKILLVKGRGTPGIHYIGPLWKLDPEDFFSWRWSSDGLRPLTVDYAVLNQYMVGSFDHGSSKGDTGTFLFLLGDDGLSWDDIWFDMLPSDPDEIVRLLRYANNESP